jgi:hypothetical protein
MRQELGHQDAEGSAHRHSGILAAMAAPVEGIRVQRPSAVIVAGLVDAIIRDWKRKA